MENNGSFRVAALYRFTSLPQWKELQAPLTEFCEARGIKGTLLLAHEGINGTVAGSYEAIAELIDFLGTIKELDGLELKYSHAGEMPFHRMKVRLKREIVTMGVDTIDPIGDAGTYVEPAEWNQLVSDPDTIIIDTRNAYETAIGTFKGAIDPETTSFTEFPRWAQARHNELKGRKVAMFCTGGIRCEKATAYMRSIGIDDVYHLKGGILKYLEEVKPEESLWEGECFVFDERVSVKHGLEEGDAELCRACRHPLMPEDRESPLYQEGVSCHHCYHTRTEEDRARYAERHKQVMLAAKRGKGPHIGN
ncbi:oxygen-dependent tRNA uridine(34) hydroxylase TrhO [Aquamicrobium zhengzhouense]|uniref:tRNA uridine(34) hydroxylase n=1 Tax=Aquamicrobium zhengzhouense TaxID=2781738 RepID=A0ABS0S8S0_9HYPH|nr:rhodanese-related sulfurtransferase [Aquamicrobium zhengzhouense]MBI1619693.1 rhodanese-related sulfurtransferase [Aquamicrobium zhengzhouense]